MTDRPLGRRWIAAAGSLVLASVVAGEAYVWLVMAPADERAAVERHRVSQASRADLRRLALDRWLGQGRHDAEMVAAFPSTIALARQAQASGASKAPDQQHLSEVLSVLVLEQDVSGVCLLGQPGRALAGAGDVGACLAPEWREALAVTLRGGGARVELGGVSVAFMAPVVEASGGRPLGAVLTVEPADAWLSPFLQSGHEAEEKALLVQWDGSRPQAWLPSSADARHLAPSSPPPQVLGPSRPRAARDHEAWYTEAAGRRVLLAVRALNEGRWTLSAGVDEAVILGPVRRQARAAALQLGLGLSLLGLATLALTYGLQRGHEARLARQRVAVATLFERANDAILVATLDGRLVEVNARAEELYGRARGDLLRSRVFDLWPTEGRPEAQERWNETLERGQMVSEAEHVGRDRQRVPVEISSRRVRWGDADAVVAIVRDVGERRRSAAQILRLNQLLRTLLEARAAVLRAGDRATLLDGVCRALTEGGLAPLAWVGWLDTEARQVRPVAGAGVAQGYLDNLIVPMDPPGAGGPVARAVQLARPALCQDVVVDPDSGPWRVAQIENGFRATAAFPLEVDGRVAAVLAIYLREPNSFGADQVGLFESLAADLGTALAALEHEADRQRAQDALRVSEERYRFLAENMADVIWTLDLPSLRFTYVSPSVRKLRGVSPEETVGQPVRASLPPAEFERLSADLRLALAALEAGDDSQRVQVRELDQVCSDGSLVATEVVTTLLTDASGRPVGVLGVSRDLSERRRGEAALHERTTLLQAILESPAQSVFALDRELRYTAFNQSHARATRAVYGREPVLGESVLEAISEPGDRARAQARCERALGGEASVDESAWGDPRLGRRLFEVSYNPIRGNDGSVGGVAVFAVDVTTRRQAEARLHQLWQAVEQSPVAVVITSPDGSIEYVNRRFCEATGYSLTEALGANPRILKSGLTPEAVYRELWATVLEGGTWRGELVNRRKDGSHFCEEVSISPVRDASGRIAHFVAVKEDVTERNRAAQALQETQQLLLQAQKMEAIGRLAAGVAHDFNNLLGVIRGNAELLRRQLAADHPGLGRLDQLLQASDRGAELARQLLTFGRKQPTQTRVLHLGRAVADAEHMLRRLIGEDVELRVVIPASLPPVRADPVQIEQVLLNLAVNARDAMPEGGSLTVELARIDPETAAADGLPPAEHVVLVVTDTGCGMDAETLSHVFEPFFTTKEVGKGTGLGLATVYSIASRLGGQARVESGPGAGSTFRVYLPADSSGADLTTQAASPVAAAGSGQGQTVLVVEDEEGLRALLEELLTSLGYRVLTAGRPDQALALARQHGERVDLLLTDVIMPGGNGRELARTLQAERPSLRVLLMSGYSADVLARPENGPADLPLLDKPFTLESLSSAVREALSS